MSTRRFSSYEKRLDLLFVTLYVAVNLLAIYLLFTSYDFKYDEIDKYIATARSLSQGTTSSWDPKISVFYPAVVAIGEVVNNLLGCSLGPDETILSFRVMHVIVVNLAFAFMYFLGRDMFNREVGLASAVFLGLMSYWLTENRHLLQDTPAATFVLGSTYFLLKGSRDHEIRDMVISAVLLMLGFLTKFPVGIFGASMVAIIVIDAADRKTKSNWLGAVATTCLIMLVAYGASEYLARGKFAYSLANLFDANFIHREAAGGGSNASWMFVPWSYYPKALLSFVLPLSPLIFYGFFSLASRARHILWQVVFLLFPLPMALGAIALKEARFVVAVVPYLILVGFYGLHDLLVRSDVDSMRRKIELGIMCDFLVVFALGLPNIQSRFTVSLDTNAVITNYPHGIVVFLQVVLLALAITLFVSMAAPPWLRRHTRVVFGSFAVLLVTSVLPVSTLGEAFGFEPDSSCHGLIERNLALLGASTFSTSHPCNLPRFEFFPSVGNWRLGDCAGCRWNKKAQDSCIVTLLEEYTVPIAASVCIRTHSTSLILPDLDVETIAMLAYHVGAIATVRRFEAQLNLKGVTARCVARNGDYGIFEIVPIP